MIKKLSESWRQQKHKKSVKHQKTSILCTKDEYEKKKSGLSTFSVEETNKETPPTKKHEKSMKKTPITPIITNNMKTPLSVMNGNQNVGNRYTKIVTRSMSSTPQIKDERHAIDTLFMEKLLSPIIHKPFLSPSQNHKNNFRNSWVVSLSSAEKKSLESTPTIKAASSIEDRGLNISQWGLPKSIENNYKKRGINTMFQWQKECLLKGNVLDGGNLIYSAPTSAGKTLVAEILMLKRVLETKKKAIYILPFVSVAREKMYSLREQFDEADVAVGGFMGSQTPPGGLNAVDIAICTIERANSIINRLMEEGKLSLLGCVVIDEMHMIGDASRGYLLELLLTKIRFITTRNAVNNSNPDESIQIIGMSATLPNLNMLAEWLSAEYYFTDYRPVPLSEHYKIGKQIFNSENDVVNEINHEDSILSREDPDNIIALCLETIREQNSVLIFCPTKNWCEKLAETISTYILEHLLPAEINSEDDKNMSMNNIKNTDLSHKNNDMKLWDRPALQAVIEELKQTPAGLDSTLQRTILAGISFHHAGLTLDERDIVEGAFRRGVIKVVVATSTLSSGVNLPARRVIIRSPVFHGGRMLDPLVYKQMVGRAGRKGVDTNGESILICKPIEKQKAMTLLTSQLKPVYSCLLDQNRSMKRALLEVIAGGVAASPSDVELYGKSTFLNTCLLFQEGQQNPEELLPNAMKFLLQNDFIKLERKKVEGSENECTEIYYPSALGVATLASSMKPEEALVVFAELQKARRNFCLESELHIIYQVSPTFMSDQWGDLDWNLYYNLWDRLPAHSKRVSELVGVQESFLARAMQNRINFASEQQQQKVRIHRRFFAALILYDLVNEVPMADVSRRYKVHKGLLQSFQNSSATFAGMVTVFCSKLGWHCMEVLLEQFQSRLEFGVCRELCNLVRIPLLNRSTARLFFQNGFQTVSAIANASKTDIIKVLREGSPFHSEKLTGGGEKFSESGKICHIWLTGLEGLSDLKASDMLIDEAKKILETDLEALGVPLDLSASVRKYLENSKEGKRKQRKRSSFDIGADRKSKKSSPNQNKPRLESLENTEFVKIERQQEEKENSPEKRIISPVDIYDGSFRNIKTSTSNVSLERQKPRMVLGKDIDCDVCDFDGEMDKNKDEEIILDSSDSLLISDSLLKPCVTNQNVSNDYLLNQEHEKDSSLSPFDLSLCLSSTDDRLEQSIVLPLRMQPQFEAACSNLHTRSEEVAHPSAKNCSEKYSNRNQDTKPKVSESLECTAMNNKFPRNDRKSSEMEMSSSSFVDEPPNNSGDLFESTEIVLNGPLENLSAADSLPPSLCKQLFNLSSQNLLDSSVQSDGEFLIIDVAASKDLFLTFLKEWKSKEQFSIAFSCESYKNIGTSCIGKRVRSTHVQKEGENNNQYRLLYTTSDLCVTGLAVCWGEKDSYFIDLRELCKNNSLDDTSLPPDVSEELSLTLRMKSLRNVLNDNCKKEICAFDMKEQLKVIFELTDSLLPLSNLSDPKMAQWLLEPGKREKNLHGIAKEWMNEEFVTLAEGVGGSFGQRGFGMVPKPGYSSRVRACVEAVLVFELTKILKRKLLEESLYDSFHNIEMPALRTLTIIEINGIGFSENACEKLKDLMKKKLDQLQCLCYRLAKHSFSLTSPDDVGKVLFLELALPSETNNETSRKTRSNNKEKSKHFRTSKDVLEKLVKYHRLPKLILEWRRVNSTLTKVVFPVQRNKSFAQTFGMYRIYSESQFHTCTGRVTFSEPNLQNVPKEFDIKISSNKDLKNPHLTKNSKNTNNEIVSEGALNSESPGKIHKVNMRSAFVPFEGGVFVSADYKQLELRILAHLSLDSNLLAALKSSTDVFKSIASKISCISVDQVTNAQRQQAKQICYGIIYGMGVKSLSEQLETCEEEASAYMESFKSYFKGVNRFFRNTIENCKKNEYAVTMAGRKRFLSSINSPEPVTRAQAERQAVNTTVQGSAADLVKTAMVKIEMKLHQKYGRCCLDRNTKTHKHRGAYLVLQLHDELLFEVSQRDLDDVIEIIKHGMETAYQLSVDTPVKVHVGKSWGILEEVK